MCACDFNLVSPAGHCAGVREESEGGLSHICSRRPSGSVECGLVLWDLSSFGFHPALPFHSPHRGHLDSRGSPSPQELEGLAYPASSTPRWGPRASASCPDPGRSPRCSACPWLLPPGAGPRPGAQTVGTAQDSREPGGVEDSKSGTRTTWARSHDFYFGKQAKENAAWNLQTRRKTPFSVTSGKFFDFGFLVCKVS